MKSLKNDNNILITRPDKGRGVVILNRDACHNELQSILDDNSKSKLMNSDAATHLLKLED